MMREMEQKLAKVDALSDKVEGISNQLDKRYYVPSILDMATEKGATIHAIKIIFKI